MSVIAILQPVYLPWLGYFEQMDVADRFVVLDDVQYTRRDWRNRNRVKTNTGPVWLTIPVRKHRRNAIIRDIRINYSLDWQRKHLKTIEANYRRSDYYQPFFDDFRRTLGKRDEMLLDLDMKMIELIKAYLGIKTEISYSSEVPRCDGGTKNERILEICKHFAADTLYDGASAAAFIDRSFFRVHGVDVVFQDYQHPIYPQQFSGFLSHQSSIDLIMNLGPEARGVLRSSPVDLRVAGRRC